MVAIESVSIPYRRTIDYDNDPIIPALRLDQIEWAKARLQTPT